MGCMTASTSPASRRPARPATEDTAAVDEAERKVGAILEDLEDETRGEVQDIGLDDLVDTGPDGQPVIRRSVDIALRRPQPRRWLRP